MQANSNDKIVVFGNSGSGKSTLATKLAETKSIAHLDLDTIAWAKRSEWAASDVPQRMPIEESLLHIQSFTSTNKNWVIEGCYADLLELVVLGASELIFLNLPVQACVENAKSRPWEPHKYESKAAQDANLEMLISWIEQYDSRADPFSKEAHQTLFDQFTGNKTMYTSNERVC